MTLSQRKYKQIKSSVLEESACGVGFFDGILEKIPDYALMAAIREIAINGWLSLQTQDGDLRNMLVTESIRHVNYQDFKAIAPYLFSYPREQRAKDRLVQPVEVSRDYFEELKANAQELFALKAEIKAASERLDTKIQELETDRMPNGDHVIGLNMDKEELLLLRNPDNAYIDDWEIERDGLINDYHKSESPAHQVIQKLSEEDKDLALLFKEAVMNEDMMDGAVLVDKEAISEVGPEAVPDFPSHRAFYDYAKQYPSFQAVFSSYDAYIKETYALDYPTGEAMSFYAQTLVANNLDTINTVLAKQGKELMSHWVAGYSQGEGYDLFYLRDTQTESREAVLDYLEHTVGAYYRGSLGELAIIKFENIDNELGYNGQDDMRYPIDMDDIWEDSLKRVQERYPELSYFVSRKEVEETQKDLSSPTRRL